MQVETTEVALYTSSKVNRKNVLMILCDNKTLKRCFYEFC